MREIVSLLIVFVLLISYSYIDLKKKEIIIWPLAMIGMVWILTLINAPIKSIANATSGLTIGLICLVISIVTREKLGYGDGIFLCVTGLLLGWKYNCAIFLIGLFLSSLFSILILLLKKGNKNTRIPLIPFFLSAFLIILIR